MRSDVNYRKTMQMRLMYNILGSSRCDCNLMSMGIMRWCPLKRTSFYRYNTTIVKPLPNNNTAERNGSQLTGGALTPVVMATVRRVNLPNISSATTKTVFTLLISEFGLYPIKPKDLFMRHKTSLTTFRFNRIMGYMYCVLGSIFAF